MPLATSRNQCFPQHVRTFREFGAVPKMATAPYGDFAKTPIALPRPGPTLRARVGDLVELTFLNQINASNFPQSMDRGETGVGGGCDESTSGYPGRDKYPDCFHGSSTGNIHFHGTHTNPGSTGDNVFIEVRPSPRIPNLGTQGGTQPTVTQASVQKDFDAFFARCETKLSRSVLTEWPKVWGDLPPNWTAEQQKLLNDYDTQLKKDYPTSGVRKLWPIDEAQLKQNAWPQYYIGAYPYCFRLPEYKDKVWPPPAPAPMQMGGEGTAEMQEEANIADQGEAGRSLIMGQSPGTHWYHAHKHGSTAINVADGMTGAFIIEGQYDDDLNKWYGENWTRTQEVLVINQLGGAPNLMRGSASRIDKGPDFSVNGQLKPVISMKPGEVQMWRIVNTSGRAGTFFSGPPAGFEWRQLAQDGVQFNDVNYQSHHNKPFLIAAGNRVDLLVKAPATACTKPGGCYSVMVQNEVDPSDLSSATPMNLMAINVTGKALDPKSKNANFIPKAPTFPLFLTDIINAEVTGTKTIEFSSTGPGKGGMHFIDGKRFDGEVGAVVLLNRVEEWKIVNKTFGPLISHPFHIHINPFQITEVFSPNDTLPDPTTPGQTIPKYIFDQTARKSPAQCYLDPQADPGSWGPCTTPCGTACGTTCTTPCPTCGPKCVPPQPPPNLIWWDVFPIPAGINATDAAGNAIKNKITGAPVQVPGYFKMRSRFVDYTGFYVIHCHILAHEDRGMMTIVEVAPSRTPYSHH
jgi:FtsP/CotA-like multicopper oxidase with cupredoxin domain